jgi:hypothetical protein
MYLYEQRVLTIEQLRQHRLDAKVTHEVLPDHPARECALPDLRGGGADARGEHRGLFQPGTPGAWCRGHSGQTRSRRPPPLRLLIVAVFYVAAAGATTTGGVPGVAGVHGLLSQLELKNSSTVRLVSKMLLRTSLTAANAAAAILGTAI